MPHDCYPKNAFKIGNALPTACGTMALKLNHNIVCNIQ